MSGFAYLYRRGGAWYWRRVVPKAVRPCFGSTLLRVSTRTYELQTARRIAQALNGAADTAFALAADAISNGQEYRLAEIRRGFDAAIVRTTLPEGPLAASFPEIRHSTVHPPMPPASPIPSAPRTDDPEALLRAREQRVREQRHRKIVMRVSELYADLERRHHAEAEDWSANTRRQLKKASELFIGLCGDLTLAEIGDAEGEDFRHKLHLLPKGYDKDRRLRTMPLLDILAADRRDHDGPALMSRTTISKHHRLTPSFGATGLPGGSPEPAAGQAV